MLIRILLILFGLFHAAAGISMIASPLRWYAAVPGVTMTGPANTHFITDIGLAFLASGAGLILGARKRPYAGIAALAGATFPFLHALFHVWLWFAHRPPAGAAMMMSEYLGVGAVSFLGMVLAWKRAKQEGAYV